MSHEKNPKQLPMTDLAELTRLATKCAEETERFRKHQDHDDGYCFELFRRAICDQDQLAWELICKQYEDLIANWWIKPHRGFKSSGEDVDQIINRTYEKFWSAITPEKFGKFPNTSSLLRYLKMCVHSVITDHNRSTNQPSLYLSDTNERITSKDTNPLPEEVVIDQEYNQEFWKWINLKLKRKKDRLVVYASFNLNLKPREIYDKYQEIFEDIDDVYATKQNVLAFLRRNKELQKLLGIYD